MVTRPTVNEVQNGYHGNPVETGDLGSSGDFDNPDEAEQAILEAESRFSAIFTDNVLFTPEIKDEDNALRVLCRHHWAVILGEAESEGQAGSNVTWSLPNGEQLELAPTRYAKEFKSYGIDTPSVNVFRTR